MKARIIEFLRAENKTSAQFAEEIGVQPSGISHIISGRNKPSLDFVLKMLEKYRFLSTEWLLFGRGSMYKEHTMADLFDQPSEDVVENEPGKDDIAVSGIDISDTEFDDTQTSQHRSVEKIVWFYNNKSFSEYFPEKE
ncbi:MAG TPA: hypothetical protein DDW27_14545 [Bacteroidales bacterium]|nr:hypothetical protein [Bacteroidales bacterium]